MEVKINKKRTIKVVIILVAIILIGIGGYYVLNNIKMDNEINETEQKIRNIDASELQDKLINAFKKTNINLQGNGYVTAFGEAKDLTMMINDNETLSKEYLGDFICAGFLISDKSENGIAVFPLFKIESDSNGKVKNILYLDISTKVYSFSDLVKNTVEQVLKDNYNIDTVIRENSKYNIKYYGTSRGYASGSSIGNYKAYKLSEKLSIYGTSDAIIKKVINKIVGFEDYYGSELVVNIFGLDIN